MQKKKSGVKKCLEILPLRGGGVGPLMANAILNFHFDFLTTSLSSSSKNANSKYTLYHIKPSQNTKVKMRDMKEHIEANHVSFIVTLNWWSAKKEADITADITQQTK